MAESRVEIYSWGSDVQLFESQSGENMGPNDRGDSMVVDEPAIRIAEEYRRRKATSVLAIMFTDIAGSTELREELGEPTYEDHREEHAAVVRDLVESRSTGAVLKDTGDGALVIFSEPSSAVTTALEIQATMASHPYFKLRVGIDMGQVSVASKGGVIADVFGRQVNRAARIQSLARPQHVLTSFPVYDCAVGWLTGTNIKWHHHGATSLKGFTEEFSIHEAYDPQRVSPQIVPWKTESVDEADAKEGTVIMGFDVAQTDIGDDVTVPSSIVLSAPTAIGPTSASEPPRSAPKKNRRFSWFRREYQVLDIPKDLPPPLQTFVLNPVVCPPGADPIRFYEQEITKKLALRSMLSTTTVILWVDDFPENTATERHMLTMAGCRFDLATTTAEAMSCLSARRYTLVITDMGRGDNPTAGLDLLKLVRSSRVQSPRFVYCSSRAASLYGEEAIEIGASLCTAGMISLLDGIYQVLSRHH